MSTEAKISHLFVEFLISLKKKGKFLHPPSNLTNSIAVQACCHGSTACANRSGACVPQKAHGLLGDTQVEC
jgi:hypothetical protein